jgi:PRC-barrel domain protein
MLHKTNYMRGFHILATDGEIGHVDDFLVNEDWTVRYLVVDTSNWLGGKWVLISTAVLEKIDSPAKQIRVRLTRDEIWHSPTVDKANIELIETLPSLVII